MRVAVSEASEAHWRDALRACPWATFFQTPEWHRRAAALLPNHRLRVLSVEAGGLGAVLPILERPGAKARLPDRRGNAAGVYGGWVGAEPLPPEAAAAVLRRLGDGASLRLRLNPFHPLPDPAALPGFSWEDDHTSVIGLDRPLEDVWSGYASGQRRNIRAAEKAGVQCRRAAGRADWEAYALLYAKTLERWGDQATSRYPDAFLLGFQDAPGAALWLAEREGRLGAAILAFEHGGRAVLWHSANDAGEAEHSPFKLLIHAIVADAHGRGLRLVDLNPSGRAAGSSQWKRLLGARELPAPVIRGPEGPDTRAWEPTK